MSKHRRFNRHDIFDSKDRTLVLDIINKVDGSDFDGIGHDTANMLYGLFDGYWYDKLEDQLETIESIPTWMLADLHELLDRVEKYIRENGVTYTQV